MALATRCPHCNTIFRVAADQLKLRGGIVRCGACKEVFDGNAMLVDLEA
ncbi:MAG: zinc-ribbon domain-containing protein, partial [Telluria sp.]